MGIPQTEPSRRPTGDDGSKISKAAFPVKSKNAAATVDGVRTEIVGMHFADKLLVTVAQEGRIGHWVHVPLHQTSPARSERRLPLSTPPSTDYSFEGSELLPMSELTATTLLGASGTPRDTVCQLLATQVASAVAAKDSNEERLLVLGVGLKQAQMGRDAFLKILEGILAVLGI